MLVSTLEALDAAGERHSVDGASAISLATRIDAGIDTGSALTALIRLLRTILTEISSKGSVAANPVAQLRAARALRLVTDEDKPPELKPPPTG